MRIELIRWVNEHLHHRKAKHISHEEQDLFHTDYKLFIGRGLSDVDARHNALMNIINRRQHSLGSYRE